MPKCGERQPRPPGLATNADATLTISVTVMQPRVFPQEKFQW